MLQIGDVVLATAGKEKGEMLVVVKLDKNYVYLADGKRLVADKPKRKSYKHIKMFSKGLAEEELKDTNFRINAKIKKILKLKKECLCQKKM